MKLFASILSVVFFTTAPTVLLAKGDTVKITIEGTALPSRPRRWPKATR